jgi:hypothetical protein
VGSHATSRPALALFSSWTLDFRESKCFLRGPKTLVERNNYKYFMAI